MQRGVKRLSFSELKVGIVILGSIVVFITMVLTATGGIGQIFSRPFIVKTRFAEVDGLLPGNEVRVAGKRVGNVIDVKFAIIPEHAEDRNTVEVTMSIDPEIATKWIRTDSKASLGSIGLLGDKVVEVSPGTKGGEVISRGAYIESSPGTNIRKIISGVDPLIADLVQTAEQFKTMATKLNEGQGTLGQLINNPKAYQELDRILLEIRGLVGQVREGEGSLGRLVNDPELYANLSNAAGRLEKIVRQIDEGQGTISRLIKDPELYERIDGLMAHMQDTVGRIDVIASRIENGEGTVGRLINDPALHEDTKEMMANVRSITERLDQGQGTAGALLHDRQLYDNLNSLSSQMVRLVYDFRQDPKKFLRVKVSIF